MVDLNKVINGYLRLYIKIFELDIYLPKRCRVCGEELDKKYKKRNCGNLCIKCYRKKRLDKIRKNFIIEV